MNLQFYPQLTLGRKNQIPLIIDLSWCHTSKKSKLCRSFNIRQTAFKRSWRFFILVPDVTRPGSIWNPFLEFRQEEENSSPQSAKFDLENLNNSKAYRNLMITQTWSRKTLSWAKQLGIYWPFKKFATPKWQPLSPHANMCVCIIFKSFFKEYVHSSRVYTTVYTHDSTKISLHGNSQQMLQLWSDQKCESNYSQRTHINFSKLLPCMYDTQTRYWH